jgi:hypothetical protein
MLKGICTHWKQDDQHASGTIEGPNRSKYRVAGNQVETDCIGRCELVVNEIVEFDAGPTHTAKSTGRIYRTAINVRRPFKDNSIDYRTHREICKVRELDYPHWLLRQRGGLLTVGLDDLLAIDPRAIVECGVEPQPGFKTWRAADIRFIALSEADVDWDSVEGQL